MQIGPTHRDRVREPTMSWRAIEGVPTDVGTSGVLHILRARSSSSLDPVPFLAVGAADKTIEWRLACEHDGETLGLDVGWLHRRPYGHADALVRRPPCGAAGR